MNRAKTRRPGQGLEPLRPEALKALLERATKLHSAGQLDEAARTYAYVEAHNPEALAASYFNGLIDVETGRLEDAATRFRRVVKSDLTSVDAQHALAYTLKEMGLWREAADAYRKALAIKPGSTSLLFELASVLEVLGRMDEVAAIYRGLADAPVTRSRALSRKAQIMPGAVTDDELADLASELDNPDISIGLRIGLNFSLGEMLERRHRDDEAFSAFARGNELRRANLIEPLEAPATISIMPPGARARTERPEKAAAQHAGWIGFVQSVFTPEFFDKHAGAGSSSDAPIFIVGMPRSGSTLLEQILSSHPKVQGLGESHALFDTIRGQYPVGPASDGPSHFRDVAQAYLKRQHGMGWKSAPRVIDKMLANYMFVGMIHLMFPKAVILHSVRDPVDTCLACYRQLFRTGQEFTYDLKDLGEHYIRYRQTMDHWAKVLPGRVIDISHEALVADPEVQIRALVQACGLKWDEACLSFHKTERAVRTASVAQVRQPIFKTSVERWRRYEKHLGPLFDALGPYAPDTRRR